jgi:hypothetical protein
LQGVCVFFGNGRAAASGADKLISDLDITDTGRFSVSVIYSRKRSGINCSIFSSKFPLLNFNVR